MKKLLIFIFTMFFEVYCFSQTVQIGTGTNSECYIPVFTNPSYSYTQQIITKDEIFAGGYSISYGTISKIRYNLSSAFAFTNSNLWKVYIGYTTKTSFSSTSDWEPLSNLTLVYDGTITDAFASGWWELTLQTQFCYNGVSNIIIAIDENASGGAPANAYFMSTVKSSVTGIMYRALTNPDPNSPPTATMITNNVPNIQLYFQEQCIAPSGFAISNINSSSANFNWTAGGTEALWNLRYKAVNDTQWINIQGISTPHYQLDHLFSVETYIVQVQANCGSNTSEWVNPITFTTPKIRGMEYSVDWDIYNNILVYDINQVADTIPDQIKKLETINTPNNSTGMDRFLSRIRGYIMPRVSGNYAFYFASDDVGQFWLSTDSSTTNAQLKSNITRIQTDWTQNESFQTLVSGKKYYFEILHYDSIYSDLIKLGWKKPGSNVIEAISSPYLTSCGNNILPDSLVFLDNRIMGYPNSKDTIRHCFIPWNTTNKRIIWTSTNTSIATVDTNGIATLLSQGNCKIIGRLESDTNICTSINVFVWDYNGPFFVKPNASINNDGQSWEHAIDLQTLLKVLKTRQGNQQASIYASEGVYKPTNTIDRNKTFWIQNVKLYGGYNIGSIGNDTTKRDIILYRTILSGEIGDQSTTFDNSYHVVRIGDINHYWTPITIFTKLDGVSISGGRASCSSYGSEITLVREDDRGGGISVKFASVNLNDCIIEDCSSWTYGAALYTTAGNGVKNNLYFNGCIVQNNQIKQVAMITNGSMIEIVINAKGSGFAFGSSDVAIKNSIFRSNRAIGGATALYLAASTVNVLNSSFYHNVGNSNEDIYAETSGVLNMHNSTVDGAISSIRGNINLISSTISKGVTTHYTNSGIRNFDNSYLSGYSAANSPAGDTNLTASHCIIGNILYGANNDSLLLTNVPGVNQLMDSIGDNGGFTPTMKLKNTSFNPAKSFGNPLYLDSLDQRGILRRDSISIGAYQWVKVDSLAFDRDTIVLCVGETKKLILEVFPNFASLMTYHYVVSDTSVSIVQNDSVIGISQGITRIIGVSDDGIAKDTMIVKVNSVPTGEVTISGTDSVCVGQSAVNYFVPEMLFADSYKWTLPNGASGISTTNGITVNYGMSANSGNIAVQGKNGCGFSDTFLFPIVVNVIPTTPVITMNGMVLHSNAMIGNQWYDQNGLINGAVLQDYAPMIEGNYYVIVTQNECSSGISNSIQVVFTGIDATKISEQIKVYPNPISNELIIEVEGNKEAIDFEISNSIGEVIFKGNVIKDIKINTSSLSSGIYLIKMVNGETVVCRKIIKG